MSPADSSANAPALSLLLPQAPSLYSATTVNTHTNLSPSELPQPEYVLAMHDYISEQHNATCLAFLTGQVIRVLNRDPSWRRDGELDGSREWSCTLGRQSSSSVYIRSLMLYIYSSCVYRTHAYTVFPQKRIQHSPDRSAISSPTSNLHSSRQSPFSQDDYFPPLMVPSLMLCRCCITLFGLIE